MCFNKKVIGGLAVLAVGVLLLTPGAAGAVLPLLLFAACPLSMLFMMKSMGAKGACKTTGSDTAADAGQIEAPKVAAASNEAELREARDELARLRAELHQRDSRA